MTQMTTTNGNGGAMAPSGRGDPRIENVKQLFNAMAPKMAKVLPKHLSAERLAQVAIACVTRTPKLLECTPQSLMHALMVCAELGLEPASSLGEIYLVPFKTSVTPIPGYRGLVSLARRSGAVTDVEAVVVREGDFWRYERGIELVLRHKPLGGPALDRPIVRAYMVAHLRGTRRPHVDVMELDEILAIKARSQTGKNNEGPWITDFAEMAKKTVVRRGCKMLPMSVSMLNPDAQRFSRALEVDDADYGEGDTAVMPDIIDTPASAIGTSPSEPSGGGLRGKARTKAAELRARTAELPAPGVIEDSFLDVEPTATPVPAAREQTAEEREQDQAEAHFAAEEKRKADAAAAKAAADKAAFLRVPAPKKPAPAAVPPDEVKLSDFKLQSPASGAAPVERVAGEDDDS